MENRFEIQTEVDVIAAMIAKARLVAPVAGTSVINPVNIYKDGDPPDTPGGIEYTASTTVDTNKYVDIDCGAIGNAYNLHMVWVSVEMLDGCYPAVGRPRAPELGGVTFTWFKDSGNLKVRVHNDSGSIKTVRAFYT